MRVGSGDPMSHFQRLTPRTSLAIAALGVLVVGLSGSARAQSTTQRRLVTYTDKNQSIWAPGTPGSQLLPAILIGPEFTIPTTKIGDIGELFFPEVDARPLFFIPRTSLGKYGMKIEFGGAFKAGITVHPWYDSGSLDYTYIAGVDVTFPRLPIKGSLTTVTAKFAGATGSNYATTSPQLGAQFGAIGQVSGYANSEAWFANKQLFGGQVFNFDTKSPDNPGEKLIGDLVKFDIPQDVNRAIRELNNVVNPIPIGAEISRPILETKSSYVKPDGTMEARAFGKFLSVQTDLAGWCFALIPAPGGEIAKRLLSGDYRVPGTDYNVAWDFCRTWANLDVGFIEKNSLGPSATTLPKITLVAKNAKTAIVLATGTDGSVTFTMPDEGVTIEPTLDLTLAFRNRFAMGVGGEVGTEPIRVKAKGSLGYGTRIAPVDFDFSVGRYVWKPEASEGALILDKTFDLRAPVEGRVRALGAVGINPKNGFFLPREVWTNPTAPDIFTAKVPAYSTDDANRSLQESFRSVQVDAEQGYTFFANNATFTATIAREGGTDTFDLQVDRNPSDPDSSILVRVPSLRLTPGQHTIALNVKSKNDGGQAVEANYRVPLTAYNPRVTTGPQLFSRSDLQPNSQTNRLRVDGTDTTLYAGGSLGVLPTTQVVLDDGTILPNDFSNLDILALAAGLQNGRTVGFTLSAGLKTQIAGAPHTIKLRAPSLIRGEDGNLLTPFESGPIPIFVVAGVPRIDSFGLDNATVASLPLKEGGYVVELRGQNFSNVTKVKAITPIGAPVELLTEYSEPGVVRVTIPQDLLWVVARANLASLGLRAETPVVAVDADAQNGATTSGGTSVVKTVAFGYLAPSLNRVADPASPADGTVTIRGRETKVRVYGDNLYLAQGSLGPATKFTLDGVAIPKERIALPASSQYALTVPYYDITLPAEPAAKVRVLSASNTGTASSVQKVSNESGAPSVTGFSTPAGADRVKAGVGDVTATISGGPFYPETDYSFINVGYFAVASRTESSVQATIPASFIANAGKTMSFHATTPEPGGGDSGARTVTVVEGDGRTISATKGLLSFDRKSNAWKQELTLQYGGNHTLEGDVQLLFKSLPAGVQLLNGSGSTGGSPFLKVAMSGNAPVKVNALFRRAGTNGVAFTNTVVIP